MDYVCLKVTFCHRYAFTINLLRVPSLIKAKTIFELEVSVLPFVA